MLAALAHYARITGSNMAPGAKKEWIDGVMIELREMPYLLVMPCLREAARRVEWPGKLVAWIVGQIEERQAKIEREQATYQRMLAIADAPRG